VADRPNIIYFVSHDTGRFLGCYGRPIPFSPNLDRLAEEGLLFENVLCSSPCCGPSRNCAMTGLYAHVSGAMGLGGMGWCLPEDVPTVVDFMNEADYQTVHMGFCHERRYGEMRYEVDGVRGVDERYWNCDARNVVNCAIEFLQARDDDRPFYMNLATNETHEGHFRGEMHQRHGGPVPREQAWVGPTDPDNEHYRARWASFYASLQYLDHHFGRLMQAVEDRGLAENTLIVYTTDHGVACTRGKFHVYEPGVEVSLIMRPPRGWGLPGGRRLPHLLPNIDFMPTMLEAAGIQPPDGINGRSFWPLVTGGDYQPRTELFVERNFHGERAPDVDGYVDLYDPQRCVRTAEFRYVRHFRPDVRPRLPYRREMQSGTYEQKPRPEQELYDRRHDPWEQYNVAERPEYESIKRDLARKLDRWMHETDDPALSGERPAPLEKQAYWPTSDRPIDVIRR
jgi:arylsulfatase A-like enzyme